MPDQFNPDPLLLPGKSPADPTQAAGFLGGQAANFLGVPDAVKALRGQMTPEEAQQFALLAGMSMVPGMRGEGMAAKALAGAEKEWGPVAARIAATTGKEGAAWHPTPEHVFTETPEGEYIYSALKGGAYADDKGAYAGESSLWKPTGINDAGQEYFPESITTEGVPDYLPTPIPERAKAAGFNVPLAHGTRTDIPFEEFALPEEKVVDFSKAEIGVHAGSPKAANRFGRTYTSNYDKPRVYPLVMRAQNPLEMPDLGNWGPTHIANYLEDHPEFGSNAVSEALGGKDPAGMRDVRANEQIQALRNLIRSKGYDSIKYKNVVEDPGHTSYIALDPNQLRSPWAAFKDLESRNLLSGLAGGAVAAPALAPGIQEYVKALSK